jgi:hypothetical protein
LIHSVREDCQRGDGDAADYAKLKRATAWLVASQEDGAWPATYLNRERDPDSDIGKFMRDAATVLAVLALVEGE